MFQLALRRDTADVAHQDFENGAFAWRQSKIALGARQNPAGWIVIQTSGDEEGRRRVRGAAQQGPAAREKFAVVEWLDEIIVGAGVQPGYAFVDRRSRRQGEDWRLDGASTDLADQVKAIAVGKAEIDKSRS